MTAPVRVPLRLASRPQTNGLVHPWINVELADGGVDFRSQHRARAHACWLERRCQMCGEHIAWDEVFLLLGGPEQLRRLLFDEPPLHTQCGVYATKACPMVAGERARYADGPPLADRARGKRCPDPGCDCGGWVQHDDPPTLSGAPAHHWYAVYARSFVVAALTDGEVHGGAVPRDQVLKVVLVSEPTVGRIWRRLSYEEIDALVTEPEVTSSWEYLGARRTVEAGR